MLLQIAEPGESKVKAACKTRVVGIDLGTTNSLVATVIDGGPRVLGDDPIVPSVVAYDGEQVIVGRAAEGRAGAVASVKRLIGRGLPDVEAVRAMLPYELDGDARSVRVRAGGRTISPVE